MEISEVKVSLDKVSTEIANARTNASRAKALLSSVSNTLAGISTDYNEMITEINGYVPTGAFETLAKDELSKLTTEFQGLKAEVDAGIIDLDAYTEY